MSLQRVVTPISSSTQSIFKFASSQPCQHLLRTFSSHPISAMSPKRKMQTSTAYTPYTLNPPPPPPPRNNRIPDTSIAGTASQSHLPLTNEGKLPQDMADQKEIRFEEQEPAEKVSVTEGEAQISKPVSPDTTTTASQDTTSTTSPKPKTRPKLRARKAAMSLTPTAVSQLRTLLASPTPKLIKVGVRNRGCSGLAYHLEYVEKPGAFDELVEQDGVKVLVDSKALFSIIGSEMDWVEDKLSRRFVFRNPNIKEQCGCGESFMV